MLFIYLLAAFSGLLSFALGVLPGPTFLALPDVAYDAVRTVSGWAGWALGLGGPDIKAALVAIIPLTIAINVSLWLWRILRHWRPPVIGGLLK